MEDIRPGQLVRSKAGRDKGEHYLVYAVIDKAQVLLVDGRKRTMARPKKKNRAHLQQYGKTVDFDAISVAGKLTDSQIAATLKELAPQETSFERQEV